MRRGRNRQFLMGNATTGAKTKSMRGRQNRCAGRKNDARATRPGEEKMRGAAGPEKNDAQMHPPTSEKNARRSEKRPARCTRHHGAGTLPQGSF